MKTNCKACCLTFNYFLSPSWRTLIKIRSSVFLYFHACKEHALIKIDHILKDLSLYNCDTSLLQYNWLIKNWMNLEVSNLKVISICRVMTVYWIHLSIQFIPAKCLKARKVKSKVRECSSPTGNCIIERLLTNFK